MEIENKNSVDYEIEKRRQHERTNRGWGGLILVGVGSVLIAHKSGVQFPEWFFTWQMIAILAGFYMGIKSRFQDWGWLIPVIVGVVFLGDYFIEDFSVRQYMWPIIIIAIGLLMMVTPRRHACKRW